MDPEVLAFMQEFANISKQYYESIQNLVDKQSARTPTDTSAQKSKSSKKSKKKSKKSPDKKPTMSGYMMFSKHIHATLKEKTDQKLPFTAVSKYISSEWGKLSKEEKEEWKQKGTEFLKEQQNTAATQVEAKIEETSEEEDFEVSVNKRDRTLSVSASDSDSEPIKKRKSSS